MRARASPARCIQYSRLRVKAALKNEGTQKDVYKRQGLDCVSFGPDLTGIHTPRERMHIASVRRTWALVKEVLKRSR